MNFKRSLSAVLTAAVLLGTVPAGLLPVHAADTPYELSDGAIKVIVSPKNGGFIVRTEEGDTLSKSDNNKDLLFRCDDFDTSFTSFRVTDANGNSEDYIFGGDYGFMGLASSDVETQKTETGIISTWSVDGITFTQQLELAGAGSNEHGAVLVSYRAETEKNEPLDIKARLLFDTAFGTQDWGEYRVVNDLGEYRIVSTETVFTEADYIPANFFVYDAPGNPTATAYHIGVDNSKPYQLAIGHWNSLASSLFDFAPTGSLDFTNVYNEQYLTADSAVGMYFDMGAVSKGNPGGLTTYYGVYSNQTVEENDSIAINLTSTTELQLAANSTEYLPATAGGTPGVFDVQAQIYNFSDYELSNITVAAYVTQGILPLDANGNVVESAADYLHPYTVEYIDFHAGETRSTKFSFKADVGNVSEFRKIEFRAFNTEDDKMLTADKIIGSKSYYVLCPGSDGKLPEVIFTSMSPDIIYNEGQRNLFIQGKNFSMLADESKYDVRLASVSGGKIYDIPDELVAFTQEEGVDTMTIMLSETMEPGDYELVIDWNGTPPSGIKKQMTSPVTRVTVSDDKQYKNSFYGIAAVTQTGKDGSAKYDIQLYKTEEEFEEDMKNYTEVLLVFRGEFEEAGTSAEPSWKATSVKLGGEAQNVITVNDCLDFENGVLTLRYNKDKSGVLVDFDGDLYTSVKRSKIWSGEASFTEIKNGMDFGLIPYNSDGQRMGGFSDMQITLLWPCGLGIAQAISGMAFNLTFGAMGIIYETNATNLGSYEGNREVKGRVISFSASLDLGFLVPNAGKSSKDKQWEQLASAFSKNLTSTELRDKWAGADFLNRNYKDVTFKDNRTKEPQGSVMVQDIIYGCGAGLLGVNFDVDLTLPGYFDAMPSIIGHLSVNTIGGYEIGVDGVCQFGTLEIEASIAIKDYKGKPIPDKLYFAIYGFEPGINVDGFGVLWLTGGGGGIDKLYDTIFGGSSVPPLKILLSVSFDILKTLAAKVDLSLSLRGLSLTARDVRVKYFDLKVLNRLQLAFEWYPDFYFMASVDANILSIIRGQGYIVIMNNEQYDAFVEFFIRASIQLPDKIPVVGGMQIAGADLGANNEKIWGLVRALSLELGITYYWGGDVDFGTGSAVSKPSFPSLLGYEDIPVYYDEETGQTLYLHAGTNLSTRASAQLWNPAEPKLLAADRTIESKASFLEHRLTLGVYDSINAALVISYSADNAAQAKQYAESIDIDGKPLVLYDAALANEATANANLVYDDAAKKAKLNVSFASADEFNRVYSITTPVKAELVLYDVNPMPSMTVENAVLNGSTLDVSWTGTALSKLEYARFYLTDDPDGGIDANLYPIGEESYLSQNAAQLAIPADLPSGTYYLKTVYSAEDFVNEQLIYPTPIVWTNENQPTAPTAVTAVNGGSYMFDLTVDNSAANTCDGYLVNVYEEENGNLILTDINSLNFAKNTDGTFPKLEVGGHFTIPEADETGKQTGTREVGLEPGKSYKIGVTAYKSLRDAEGNETGRVLSAEVMTAEPITLLVPIPPSVTVVSSGEYTTITRKQDGVKEPVDIDTFPTANVTFTVASDVPVNGTWTLNDSTSGEYKAGEPISFTGLEDGDYTLTLTGEDAEGDTFITTKSFSVDTLPPVLLLSSPVNGSLFDADGTIVLSGIADIDARLTITVNGSVYASGRTLSELGAVPDSSGRFTLRIAGNPAVSTQTLSVSAVDAVGNVTETKTATVYHKGFSSVDGLTVYLDGRSYPNGNIPTGTALHGQLSLGVEANGTAFFLSDDTPIEWSILSTIGSASIDQNGYLHAESGSMGIITAKYRVIDLDDTAIADGYVGAMQGTLTFGAENNILSDDFKTVTATAGIGGNVTGDGSYMIGSDVTLTAVPDTGYRFTGWNVLSGGIQIDRNAATVTFTLLDTNVELEATFALISSPIETPVSSASTTVQAGNIGSLTPPDSTREYVPYYFDQHGEKAYVKFSSSIDGKIRFIAPVNATYFLEARAAVFSDIDGHWANTYIRFVTARSIYSGISDTEFAPDTDMTRAMLVTVLGRLSGITADSNAKGTFDDVSDGQWYTPYVTWAHENGIVKGYDNGCFGPEDPVTREQMCVILKRWLDMSGYTLPLTNNTGAFPDADRISTWAYDSVQYIRSSGLIIGDDRGYFSPLANSSRAQVATILFRLITALLETQI